jgi:MSHA biogenesis protein MshJ
MASIAAWFDRARAGAAQVRRAFDARARRERLLLIGAGIAVAWMLADSLWLTPAFKEWSAARTRNATAVAALQRLNDDIARRGTETRTAEQQLHSDVAQWRERVVQGDAALRSFGATLVNASDMVPMLDALLAQVGGLRMRSMQSLGRTEVGAPVAVTTASTTTESKAAGALFRYGVELTVEGSYADVVAYLRAIEAMPQHVLWGDMQLKVDQHPKVVVTLRLYTLSQDRSWLEI